MNNGLYHSFYNGALLNESEIHNEIHLEEFVEKREEFDLKTDALNSLERRILIALYTYGTHDLNRAASWVGLSKDELCEIVRKSKNIKNSVESGEIPCWTKAELISRLCVEAETAPKASERITAITKLMEFRGLATPEGGARSFTRTIARFRK